MRPPSPKAETGMPSENLPRASRIPGSLQMGHGSELQEVAAVPPTATQDSWPAQHCRLHLWQKGQRKASWPSGFHSRKIKAHSFKEEEPLAGLPEC